MENKYPTIEKIINQENGQWDIIKSVDFFKDQHLPARRLELFKIRQDIIEKLNIGNPPFICSHCKIPVKISGGNLGERIKSLHFRHAYRSPNCIYHDLSQYTKEQILCMKFNGAKEGFQHEYLKNAIASILENDKDYPPLKVEIEKIVRSEIVSKEWRKPDVRAIYSDKAIVFELQIATTFVDVILARSNFYKQKGTYLIWILDKFSTDLKEQTFSQTDILVSSNHNIFVFDKEMEELSKKTNKLHLTCHYIYHENDKNKLSPPLWDSKVVTLQDLYYDEKYRAFCYDTEGKKEELLEEIEVKKEEKRQYLYETYNFSTEIYSQERGVYYKYQPIVDLIKDSLDEKYFMRLEAELDQLSDSEMDELSNIIQDEIVEWYMESFNQYFVRFILGQERFYIDLERLTIKGTTPLLYLVDSGYEKDVFYSCIYYFFKRGYRPKPIDKRTIKNYISFILKKKELEEDYLFILEKNSIALHYINLLDAELDPFKILHNYKTRQFILRVFSVLINQIVGSKQKGFSSITNDVIVNNIEYSHLFIVAMQSARGRKNDYGKNGVKLLDQFDNSRINHDLDNVFQVIFPNINWINEVQRLLPNK